MPSGKRSIVVKSQTPNSPPKASEHWKEGRKRKGIRKRTWGVISGLLCVDTFNITGVFTSLGSQWLLLQDTQTEHTNFIKSLSCDQLCELGVFSRQLLATFFLTYQI